MGVAEINRDSVWESVAVIQTVLIAYRLCFLRRCRFSALFHLCQFIAIYLQFSIELLFMEIYDAPHVLLRHVHGVYVVEIVGTVCRYSAGISGESPEVGTDICGVSLIAGLSLLARNNGRDKPRNVELKVRVLTFKMTNHNTIIVVY